MTHETYSIQKATLKIETKSHSFDYTKFLFKKILRCLFKIIIFTACFIFTFFIFRIYVDKLKLDNTIAIGALLSSLGTSITSISNLFCNESRERFTKNTEMLLKTQKEFEDEWEHRPFLKRMSKHKRGDFYEYCTLKNPLIDFNGLNWSKKIDVPTSTNDFIEFPVVRNYLKLFFNRKNYRKLLDINFENYSDEILVWDNLTDSYKRIIVYKIFSNTSFIGISIVINSLLFSFFYNLVISGINF